MKHRKPRPAVIWGGSLLISLPIVNLLCLLFTDSIESTTWDEATERGVPVAGRTHRHRTEGWAETEIGRYAVHGVADVGHLEGPKIIFWGDSHVEGYPLHDRDKVAQQFNRLTAEADGPTAFAVGISGSTVGTTHRLIPHYERLAAPVVHHFIVVARMHFILPDDDSLEPNALTSRPVPAFRQVPLYRPNERSQALLLELRRFRLPLPFLLYRKATRLETRFHPGTAGGRSPAPEPPDLPDITAAWRFLLERLQERTDVPIAFVYCPSVPYLDGGRVSQVDRNLELADAFAAECRRQGIPFISLHQEFSRLYETSGRFPRGFANNNPHKGHLNPHGMRLVASKVAAFLSG